MPIKLNGATNGSVELDVPAAVGSDLQITLPATAGEAIVKAADGSVDLGSVDIDSSGRVGIGTSSPGRTLDVSGSIRSGGSTNPFIALNDNTTEAYFEIASSVTRLSSGTSQPLAFRIASTEAMRIDSSGNVGIGESSPSEKLDVNGSILAERIRLTGAIYENDQNISADYSITSGSNAMSAGPITIDSGVTVTVTSGCTWTVV
jgi:hypothetical protein